MAGWGDGQVQRVKVPAIQHLSPPNTGGKCSDWTLTEESQSEETWLTAFQTH